MTRWHKQADLKRLDKALLALAETTEDTMDHAFRLPRMIDRAQPIISQATTGPLH